MPDDADGELAEEFKWATQKWHDAWAGLKDHEGPSVIYDIVRHAFNTGRRSASGDKPR